MIANQGESLTGVRERDVLAELGDVLFTKGCVREQRRRMVDDLVEARRIAAEELAKGRNNVRLSTTPTPPEAQQVPVAGSATDKEKGHLETAEDMNEGSEKEGE